MSNIPILELYSGCRTTVLTHTYPHKPVRKIKVTVCYLQVDSPIYLWPDVCFGDLQAKKEKRLVIHDTERSY